MVRWTEDVGSTGSSVVTVLVARRIEWKVGHHLPEF